MDSMRRAVLLLVCSGALAATVMLAGATAPTGAGFGLAEADAAAAKKPAKRFRTGYLRWRGRLQRHDLYVGRDLLPRVRAADGSARAPTKRELRRSIHRMQRRWARYTRITRGPVLLLGLRGPLAGERLLAPRLGGLRVGLGPGAVGLCPAHLGLAPDL